jgi:hypothetical protein
MTRAYVDRRPHRYSPLDVLLALPAFILTVWYATGFVEPALSSRALFVLVLAIVLLTAVLAAIVALQREPGSRSRAAVLTAWLCFDVYLAFQYLVYGLRFQFGFDDPARGAHDLVAGMGVPAIWPMPLFLVTPLVAALVYNRYQVAYTSHSRAIYGTAATLAVLLVLPTTVFLFGNLLSIRSPIHFFGFNGFRELVTSFAIALVLGCMIAASAVAFDQIRARRTGVSP